ncbi:hypothetical protein GCM10010372_67930 [Streptomyces tauricus]|nr:hypothetical protein GCM10010372_67930 [Streptomyces tauricus]
MLQLDQPMYGLAARADVPAADVEVGAGVGVAACADGRAAAVAAVSARTRRALSERRAGAVGAYEDDRMGRNLL